MTRRSSTRTRPGNVLLQQVRQKLSQQVWPPGLTVLTGDDVFHLDAAQRALVEALVPEDVRDLALNVFGRDPVDVARVVAAARSRPMFAPRRVVLVGEIDALEGEADPLVTYAQQPPPDSYLLVRAPELDQRRKLHKALARHGRRLIFALGAFSEYQRSRVVTQLAAERGLTLERAAAALLSEACAGDFYRVAGELDKIRIWMGREGKVTLDGARQIVFGSGVMSGWEVAEAITLRDRAAAMAAARRLVEAGDEPIRIVGGVAWRARTMLQAKAMLEEGVDRHQVISETGVWGTVRDEIRRGMKRYSLQELMRMPALLLEADRALKSRSVDPRAVMESLVENLTADGHGKNSERR